ncbi:MAG: hypothetical protein A2Y10_20280 [Planctomycetes bacterium GWF2_41_51]|nr:MAG: hypothetical protein A2Y10_20280 [Planctomycetes bacterium GWF2_41_51]HBG25747.1 hypothetical protein [Phycisphaerales bacterium]
MKNSHLKDAVLCTGGDKPGLHIFDIYNKEVRSLISLKSGESVYTSDISEDGKAIVSGTKSGYLIHTLLGDNADSHIERYFLAAPILSVLFLNNYTIAASDLAGKVFIWNRDDKRKTKILDSCTEPVCSLFCPNVNLLGGLSISGDVYLWDLADRGKPAIVKGSELPRVYGLIDIICWNGLWVWPDHSGRIILFDAESRKLNFLNAHSGSLYSICTYKDYLVSLGKSDGVMKFWKFQDGKPCRQAESTYGAISLAMWDQQGISGLIINENGRAQSFAINDDKIISTGELAGNFYRKVIGPNQDMVNKYINNYNFEQVEQLCVQIKQKINNNEFIGLSLLYQQLDQLGLRNIHLWLRACQAEKENDILTQLKQYQELYSLLKAQERESPEFVAKYSEVLKRCWQPDKAICVVNEFLGKRQEEYLDGIDLKLLQNFSKALANEICIIDSRMPLPIILQAANLLNNKIKARIIYKRLSSYPVDINIDPCEFLIKFKEEFGRRNGNLQQTVLEKAIWMTDDEMAETSVIILKLALFGSLCLEYIIKFISEFDRTAVITTIVLNPEQFYKIDQEISDKSISAIIESNLNSIQKNENITPVIKHLVKRYITKSKSYLNTY